VWDFFWLCLALASFGVFSRQFFFDKVVPDDPVWPWMRRKFKMSDRAMLATYRAYFVYGGCRIFAWFLWARLFNEHRGTETLDWHWGGPRWAWPDPIHGGGPLVASHSSWAEFLWNTFRGGALLAFTIWALWALFIRRLYVRAT
jgi:hypothetical protein